MSGELIVLEVDKSISKKCYYKWLKKEKVIVKINLETMKGRNTNERINENSIKKIIYLFIYI